MTLFASTCFFVRLILIAAEDFAGAKSAADALKASADTLGADLTAAKDKIKC